MQRCATEVDDDGAGTWTVDQQGRRAAASSPSRRSCTTRRTTSGVDPGLVKDGVEAHLQELLAEQVETLRRRLAAGAPRVPDRRSVRSTCCAATPRASRVAVEIKRRGDIDGVEQLTRYLELLNRDPLLAPVRGIFAAQEIKPQARVLALDRGIDCVTRRLRRAARRRRPHDAALLRLCQGCRLCRPGARDHRARAQSQRTATSRRWTGVDLDVRRGEIFALLGPNGAGKTTTVEILEGYRRP